MAIGMGKIARVTYHSQTQVLAVFDDMTYAWFCNEIKLRYEELSDVDFLLFYAQPNCPLCRLRCDDDVKLMFDCLLFQNIMVVDVLVSDISVESSCNVSVTSTGQSSLEFTGVSTGQSCSSNIMDSDDDEAENEGEFRTIGASSYLTKEWIGYIRRVGQRFEGGVNDFREKLCKYAIEMGFVFRYKKNEPKRVRAVCANKDSAGCNWMVFATLCTTNGAFYIRKLRNVHTCQGVLRRSKSVLMVSKVVSSIVKDRLVDDPNLRPIDIRKQVKQLYGLDVSYKTAWKGKEIAKQIVHGDDFYSYQHLVSYCKAVEESNPNSYCILECHPVTNQFRRIFMCFGGCAAGFKCCRPLLFIDATHIKNKYKGQLLGATGKNGNEGDSDSFSFSFHLYVC